MNVQDLTEQQKNLESQVEELQRSSAHLSEEISFLNHSAQELEDLIRAASKPEDYASADLIKDRKNQVLEALRLAQTNPLSEVHVLVAETRFPAETTLKWLTSDIDCYLDQLFYFLFTQYEYSHKKNHGGVKFDSIKALKEIVLIILGSVNQTDIQAYTKLVAATASLFCPAVSDALGKMDRITELIHGLANTSRAIVALTSEEKVLQEPLNKEECLEKLNMLSDACWSKLQAI